MRLFNVVHYKVHNAGNSCTSSRQQAVASASLQRTPTQAQQPHRNCLTPQLQPLPCHFSPAPDGSIPSQKKVTRAARRNCHHPLSRGPYRGYLQTQEQHRRLPRQSAYLCAANTSRSAAATLCSAYFISQSYRELSTLPQPRSSPATYSLLWRSTSPRAVRCVLAANCTSGCYAPSANKDHGAKQVVANIRIAQVGGQCPHKETHYHGGCRQLPGTPPRCQKECLTSFPQCWHKKPEWALHQQKPSASSSPSLSPSPYLSVQLARTVRNKQCARQRKPSLSTKPYTHAAAAAPWPHLHSECHSLLHITAPTT